jgi:hypothetical protein
VGLPGPNYYYSQTNKICKDFLLALIDDLHCYTYSIGLVRRQKVNNEYRSIKACPESMDTRLFDQQAAEDGIPGDICSYSNGIPL